MDLPAKRDCCLEISPETNPKIHGKQGVRQPFPLKGHFLAIQAVIPSGKRTKNHGKSSFLMGKLTINGHFQ